MSAPAATPPSAGPHQPQRASTVVRLASRDGFWLARWLRAQGIEAHVIHAASVAVLGGHMARAERHTSVRGYIARGGQIVDASIVPVPKQRNTREENEAVKRSGWLWRRLTRLPR